MVFIEPLYFIMGIMRAIRKVMRFCLGLLDFFYFTPRSADKLGCQLKKVCASRVVIPLILM